ncbi:LysE family translocator [Chitinimonas sp. BJB300]|uniref:LysE family translocator n=1 Tax=Chitinimonas sp. BJB300 TaxID=1559339 RepID=UPI000C1212A9|nr:LysE family translocator [Chitinimonas sp. BJB300]PHV12505.1 amino acid transporter [Chitinimonas sp. BJB300]TSJ91145.1 LysE family translocator [Chitinimonas sp. BJB300]
MSLQLWLAYVATVFLISGTPGPNMLLAMTHGIRHGFSHTISTMLGLLAGLVLIFSISLGGLGAILLASSHAFDVIKYIGAAYLIYIGVKTWRSTDTTLHTQNQPDTYGNWTRFRSGFLVALSNPKAILFGVAFFPQFLDNDQPIAGQASILLLTFAVIETGWMCIYASGGAKLALWLQQGCRMSWFNRIAGGAFVGAGMILGSFRR